MACTAKNSKFNQIVISEVSIFNDDDEAGAIVGYSSKSVFSNCSNSGYVMHCEEDDFLTCTRRIKQKITDRFDEIIADLERMYDKQDFSL